MKNIRKIIAVGLIALLAISCNDLDELNVNPNAPTADNPATEALLASCMRKAFHEDRFEFWRGVVLHGERFAAHVEGGYSGCWWGGATAYDYNEGWTAGVWDSYNSSSFMNGFGGSLFANVKLILEYLEANPETSMAKEFKGIAVTIRAFQFLKISDAFGDLPYSEHGDIDNPSPKFDTQKQLYDGLEAELKQAVEDYLKEDVTIATLNTFDIVYGGDVSNWRKFANSLRLRMALRRSNAEPDVAASILANVVNYPLFESNEDNLVVKRTSSTIDLQNQYYGFFKTWPGSMEETDPENPDEKIKLTFTWDGYTMNWAPGPGAFIPAYEIIEVMKGSPLFASNVNKDGSSTEDINALSGIYDPRIDKFFMAPRGDKANDHKGRPARANYFVDENDTIRSIAAHSVEGNVLNYSWMHPSIWYDNGTWNPVSMDYAEVCLAMAEAVQRNLVTSDKSAQEWLSTGLAASCKRWGAEPSSFISDVEAKFSAASEQEKIAIIATERWISAYTVQHEAYSVLRRTRHPEYCYLDKNATVNGIWKNADGTTERKDVEVYAQGSTNFALPQRMRVPESEVSVNANVPEASKNMANKVWWANY
ncbi:SusD/RagB family nutrient-binding outer membrane lipoprotein [Carboxylicivirga taeanensis]|uniref:SusD/RagB family nutrient-binding outer membrane lipoprotein n=1 Tax=Carboxylicivirga taeanensis TaxID=1416875 RepID=UPI003F6E0B13